MKALNSPRFLRNLFLFFTSTYLVVALCLGPYFYGREIFPFFDWDLFSEAVDELEVHELHLTLDNGKTCQFYDCPETLKLRKNRLIQYALRGFSSDREKHLKTIELVVRKNVPHCTRFAVVRKLVSPTEYHRNRRAIEEHTVTQVSLQ